MPDSAATWFGALLGLSLIGLLARTLWKRELRARRRTAVRELIQQCAGDQDLAERLMWQEMQDDPAVDFTDAARRATRRLQRDRH